MKRVALVVLLAACGNSGPTHWKDQALIEVTGTADGHAYSIQLPKGMQASTVDPTEYAYHQDVSGEDYVFAPRVHVHFTKYKQTIDEALKLEKEPTIRKDVQPDGWLYS